MGFQATVTVLNDALQQIEKNPEEFVQGMVNAIRTHNEGGDETFSRTWGSGNHCNCGELIDFHHGDQCSLLVTGGNTGAVIDRNYGWSVSSLEHQKRVLEDALVAVNKKIEKELTTQKA